MNPIDPTRPEALDAILADLEHLLGEERRALRVLDHRNIALAAERKLELDLRLRAALARRSAGPEHRAALERIGAEARLNHLLLSHARSCVTSILDLARGAPRAGYRPSGQITATPLRLNFRG